MRARRSAGIAAQCLDQARLRFRRRREVEPRHMGKNDRVGLGVRQAEPAEHVRELVLQRRPGGEHDAGKPRRNETFRARLAVGSIGNHPRQMHAETARRVARERHQERRAVGHPEPSTQWAMAFMALAALTAAGRPRVRSGS